MFVSPAPQLFVDVLRECYQSGLINCNKEIRNNGFLCAVCIISATFDDVFSGRLGETNCRRDPACQRFLLCLEVTAVLILRSTAVALTSKGVSIRMVVNCVTQITRLESR